MRLSSIPPLYGGRLRVEVDVDGLVQLLVAPELEVRWPLRFSVQTFPTVISVSPWARIARSDEIRFGSASWISPAPQQVTDSSSFQLQPEDGSPSDLARTPSARVNRRRRGSWPTTDGSETIKLVEHQKPHLLTLELDPLSSSHL
jgi:hypothetical protein